MFDLNDIVEMKKPHACKTNRWQIIRMGADIKIKCLGCEHIVMMPRREFTKKSGRIYHRQLVSLTRNFDASGRFASEKSDYTSRN